MFKTSNLLYLPLPVPGGSGIGVSRNTVVQQGSNSILASLDSLVKYIVFNLLILLYREFVFVLLYSEQPQKQYAIDPRSLLTITYALFTW
jgi:hypothetical protein